MTPTPDPSLQVAVRSWLAELGGLFEGHLGYDRAADPGSGAVRGARVELSYRTEGRGTRHQATVSVLQFPLDVSQSVSTPFQLPVPPDAPISYDGNLIRVHWQVEAIVDRSWRSDHTSVIPVVVAPVGAFGLYRGPHPHRI